MSTTELLQLADGVFSPKGLSLPENFRRADFEQLARGLASASRAMQWAIGDLAAFGERKWGVSYDDIHKLTGYDLGTIANYASAAKRVPFSRRREDLPFSMHVEVAALEADEQERWLNEAQIANYSVRELRAAIQRRTVPIAPATETTQHFGTATNHQALSAPIQPKRLETGERNEAMLEASRAARFPQSAPSQVNASIQCAASLPPIEAPELAIILSPHAHKQLYLLVQHFNSQNRRPHTVESFLEGMIEQAAVRTLPRGGK